MPPIPPIPLPIGQFPPFPPGAPVAGSASFTSSGDIDIWWSQPTAAQVFDLQERRRSSYHFFGEDPATTVWRSGPLVSGSAEDVFGVPIGPVDSILTVSSSDIRRRPQIAIDPMLGVGERRKFFAELHSLQMRGDGVELLAGEPFFAHLVNDLRLNPSEVARIFRRSYGEVLSWDLGGDQQRDFPADNHFNVFYALKFNATKETEAFTIYNNEPMVVVDLGLTSVPPLDRVTIPQFPNDMPSLYYAGSPDGGISLPPGSLAAAGGCCAHSVRGAALDTSLDLPFRPVGFGELASDVGISDVGTGLDLRSGLRAVSGARAHLGGEPRFRNVASRFIDGVFVPNRASQISSSGLSVLFEDTSTGGVSDAVWNAASAVYEDGTESRIDVDAPNGALAYQPPQPYGIGLGPNGGITFDIAALRKENPDFYLVNMVALAGMSRESPRGTSIHLRILVDGVEVPFASRKFDVPGASHPLSVDLQMAQRYLTLVSTSRGNAGNGVFALFQLRGFGTLSGDKLPGYSGPARPDWAAG